MQRRLPFSRVLSGPPGIESISFELHESEQYLAYSERERKRSRVSLFLATRWVLVIVTGICTALTGVFIDFSLGKLFVARFGILTALLRADVSPVVLLVVHIILCTSLAACAGLLVCFVEPLAAGSGIPEVKCRLNGVDLPRVVHPKTYVAKAVGVLFSVAAGLPVGKEGPMIHSGAIIGGMLSWVGRVLFREEYNFDLETRELITAGSAAGVATAFGAPLGGVLFAMEEGSSFWNVRVLLRSFICSAVAALTLNFFLVGINDQLPWGYLGSLGVLTFGSFLQDERNNYKTTELPIFILIGLLGGLIGALFNGLNIVITRWRMRFIGPRGIRRFFEVLFVTATISGVAFIPPLVTSTCYVPSINETQSTRAWIHCDPVKPGHGSSFVAAIGLFVTPSEDSIKVLFHDPHNFDNEVLIAFIVVYFLSACWTYGLGVPSGLFVPSLLTGGALGRLCGQLLQQYTSLSISNPGTYALIGAAAVLAGMARITISLAVILVEATGNTQWSLPVLFTVSASKWAGDFFNHGLYDIHIHLKNVPMLEPFAEHDMKRMRVENVMVRDVKTLDRNVTVRRVMDLLSNCSHHGFPVLELGNEQFCGMVQRNTLLNVLRYGRDHGSFCNASAEVFPLASQEIVPYVELARSRHVPTLEEIRDILRPEDYDALLQLTPYVDCAAISVQAHATLRRAFVLFRSLGLRHMPVVSCDGRLLGLVTRKELILTDAVDDTDSNE